MPLPVYAGDAKKKQKKITFTTSLDTVINTNMHFYLQIHHIHLISASIYKVAGSLKAYKEVW